MRLLTPYGLMIQAVTRARSRALWWLTATATADVMVYFATLRWGSSVVYGRPAAYHRAMGPPWG